MAARKGSDTPRIGQFCSVYCSRDKSAVAQVKPTLQDLAWAAGFIEGEGCFSVHKYTKSGKKPHPFMGATQVQREPLERLVRYFGGQISKSQHKIGQPIHLWRVYGTRARGVAMTLYAWLSPRRRGQAQALLTA